MISYLPAAGGNTSNLAGGWNNVFSKINSAFPGLLTLMTSLGVLIVVGAIGKYFWDKRRGGANASALGWSLAVGGLLAAPGLIVPICLKIADSVINAVAGILGGGK